MGQTRGSKILPFFVAAAFLVGGISLMLAQLERPPVIDEAVYLSQSRAIAETGVPYMQLYYSGDGLPFYQKEMRHPPGWGYVAALGLKMFGPTSSSIRLMHILLFLGTLYLLYLFGLELFKRDARAPTTAIVVPALCIISPYLIQSVLLIDVDNSVLFFLLTLFVYVYSKLGGRSSSSSHLLLSVLFALTLWAKLATPFMLLGALLVMALISRQGSKKRAMASVLTIGLVGIVLFLITYSLYTAATGMPFADPFSETVAVHINRSIGNALHPSHWVASILTCLPTRIAWLTPATLLLIIIGLIDRASRLWKGESANLIDFSAIFGVIVLLCYILIRPLPVFDFPKYEGLALPFLLSPVAPLIGNLFQNLQSQGSHIRMSNIFLCGIIIAVLFLYNEFIVGDPVYAITYKYIDATNIAKWLQQIKILLVWSLPLLPVLGLLKLFRPNWRLRDLMLATVLLVLLPSNISLALHQAKGEYSTTYVYGERGLREVEDYVRRSYCGEGWILARKDIGYAFGQKFSDYYVDATDGGLESLAGEVRKLKPTLIVISYRLSSRTSWERFHEAVTGVLSPMGYVFRQQIGDFEVYAKENCL